MDNLLLYYLKKIFNPKITTWLKKYQRIEFKGQNIKA